MYCWGNIFVAHGVNSEVICLGVGFIVFIFMYYIVRSNIDKLFPK